MTPSFAEPTAVQKTLVFGPLRFTLVLASTRCATQMPHWALAAPVPFTRPTRPARLSALLSAEVGSIVYQPAAAGTVVAGAEPRVGFQAPGVARKFGSAVVLVEAKYSPA